MKKYLLPSALILAFGLALALAQNINKAIQLSQDATGAFGVDTNNNVYFPGHVLTVGPGTPAVTSCGGGTPTIAGTDTAGTVALGTSAAGCTITFSKAYLAAPTCILNTATMASPISWTTSTTAITEVNYAAVSSQVVNYICTGAK